MPVSSPALLRRRKPKPIELISAARFRRHQPTPVRLITTASRPGRGLLRAIGWTDQRVLMAMRTTGHAPATERVARAFGTFGESGVGWLGIGAVAAAVDFERRAGWYAAAAAGPVSVTINYAVKVLFGRERPLIDEHPMLARAPSKLSFPSAHSTSSVAAATALTRMEPRLRAPIGVLAATVCVSRPFLGMHYPTDVLAGVVLGSVLGRAWPLGSAEGELWAR